MVVHQAPLSMRFSRQEYWNGLPFAPPGDLPNPGIEPVSPALTGGFFTTEPLGMPINKVLRLIQSVPDKRVLPAMERVKKLNRNVSISFFFFPIKMVITEQ